MAKSTPKKKSEKITFRHADLDHLCADEKCMFMQAGMVLNDLRFFDLSLHNHFEVFRTKSKRHDAEVGILFSQIALLLAHLAGTLNEAHQVIVKSYYRPTVSKKYALLLSPGATEALSRIKTFFSNKDNLVSLIRNNFGFHYDRDRIINILSHFPPDWEHHTYLPYSLNNAFLEFGQTCSMHALFKATGATNSVEGLFRVYQVLGGNLMSNFVIFYHGVLQAISNTIPAKASPDIMRVSSSSPALFNPRLEVLAEPMA